MVVQNKPGSATPPLSREDVLEKLKCIIAENATVAPEAIQETHTLLGDLGCDSLDVIEIAMEVEEQFDISIPDELSDQFQTVGDIADGILDLLAQQS